MLILQVQLGHSVQIYFDLQLVSAMVQASPSCLRWPSVSMDSNSIRNNNNKKIT